MCPKQRWGVKTNGILRGGWRKLENVTPRVLRNAIFAHNGIQNIQGFDRLDGEEGIRGEEDRTFKFLNLLDFF